MTPGQAGKETSSSPLKIAGTQHATQQSAAIAGSATLPPVALPHAATRHPLAAHTLLNLQRAVGNRATGRYLTTQPRTDPAHTLTVQRATDPAEREADQVANEVRRAPDAPGRTPISGAANAKAPAVTNRTTPPIIQRKITTKLIGGVMEQEQQDLFTSTDPVIQGRLWNLIKTYWTSFPVGDNGTLKDEYTKAKELMGSPGFLSKRMATLYKEVDDTVRVATGPVTPIVEKANELERYINNVQLLQEVVGGNLTEVFPKLPGDISLVGELIGTIRIVKRAFSFSAQTFGILLNKHSASELPQPLRQLAGIPNLPAISFQELLPYGDLYDIVDIYAKGEKRKSEDIVKLVSKMTTPRIDRLKVYYTQEHVMGGATPETSDQAVKLLQYGTLQELQELLKKFFVAKTAELIQTLESAPELQKVNKKQRMYVLLNEHLRPDPKSERTPFGFTVSDSEPIGPELTALIETIRGEQRARKQGLEANLSGKLNSLDKDDQNRSRLIKEHATNLKPVGMSKGRLEGDRRFQDLIKDKKLNYDSATGKITKEDKDEVGSLFSGDAAFDPNPIVPIDVAKGIHRAVFQKRGKKPDKSNQYVKDDQDVYTRRYIFIEKNRHQFRDLLSERAIQGRYSTDPSQQTAQPYNAISPDLRDQVPDLPNQATFENPYQLAYVHQELGSGIQQRGVSASATGKYDIFSNQGLPFKSSDGVRFEVDLARVPPGASDKLPEVINHYAPAAQAKMKGKIDTYKIQKRDHQRQFEHYQWSVTKNREIFMKDIKPGYLSSITLHKTTENKSHTETSAEGFSQEKLKELGEKVGAPAYNLGFADGTAGKPDQSAAQPKDMQKLYTEGYKDGKEYLLGFQKGQNYRSKLRRAPVNRGHAQSQVFNDPRVRFVQGYWDGVYGRPLRKYT